MNQSYIIRNQAALILLALLAAVAPANSQTESPKPVIPLIVMDEVPLMDAIKNLARQANINYIVDPRVTYSFETSPSKTVSVRWENLTAEKALDRMLTSNKLALIENPATAVARITAKDQNVKPVDPKIVGTDTSKIIPLIVMTDVPLADAIRNLSRQAGLDVQLDPQIQSPKNSDGRPVPPFVVDVRWEGVSPRQALFALMDNYNLTLTEDSTRIVPKK